MGNMGGEDLTVLLEEEILNGERFQQLADVCIATTAKLAAHPSRPSVPVANISADSRIEPPALELIRAASIIFVYRDFLDLFFMQIAPKLERRFVLITNGSVPEFGERFRQALDRTTLLVHVFAINATMTHPKLTTIPLGLANSHWPHGNTAALVRTAALELPKRDGLYVNFDIGTNPWVRAPIFDALAENDFATIVRRPEPSRMGLRGLLRLIKGRPPIIKMEEPLGFEAYLKDMAQWEYCVSPPGNGLDCHRTWEALYLGVTPVLSKAPVGVLEGLPHIIVDDWSRVSSSSLRTQREAMRGPFQFERLNLSYWRKRVEAAIAG
jgi:hypothetical protein